MSTPLGMANEHDLLCVVGIVHCQDRIAYLGRIAPTARQAIDPDLGHVIAELLQVSRGQHLIVDESLPARPAKAVLHADAEPREAGKCSERLRWA